MRRRWLVREGVLDLRHGRVWVLGKQFHRGDHHSALAVAALWNLFIDPRLLNRVERLGCVSRAQPSRYRPNGWQPFDSGHVLAYGVRDWSDARADFFAIE